MGPEIDTHSLDISRPEKSAKHTAWRSSAGATAETKRPGPAEPGQATQHSSER